MISFDFSACAHSSAFSENSFDQDLLENMFKSHVNNQRSSKGHKAGRAS